MLKNKNKTKLSWARDRMRILGSKNQTCRLRICMNATRQGYQEVSSHSLKASEVLHIVGENTRIEEGLRHLPPPHNEAAEATTRPGPQLHG